MTIVFPVAKEKELLATHIATRAISDGLPHRFIAFSRDAPDLSLAESDLYVASVAMLPNTSEYALIPSLAYSNAICFVILMTPAFAKE
jgi:hypothetical protein